MLMDFEPLDIEVTKVTDKEVLKNFKNKKVMQQLLLELISYDLDENTGKYVLDVPGFDERVLANRIFNGSNQRRVLPPGFRVIDYEVIYTPLGRAEVIVSAFVVGRKGVDGRHPDKEGICETRVYYVWIEKTGKWLLVDLENENHQNTIVYRERELEELDLEEKYREKYDNYYDKFSVMAVAAVVLSETESVKKYVNRFEEYIKVASEGFDAYRFFDSITPIEHKYVKKYFEQLNADFTRVKGNLEYVTKKTLPEMFGDEKEKFDEVTEIVKQIKSFFHPRTEKNPDIKSSFGYCPTFRYQSEIPRRIIPNAAEIERRDAYNSADVFWSEEREKAFLQEMINHLFGSLETGESEEEKVTIFVEGILGDAYKITVEQFEEFKKSPKEDALKEFLKIAQLDYEPKFYMKHMKVFTDALKNY